MKWNIWVIRLKWNISEIKNQICAETIEIRNIKKEKTNVRQTPHTEVFLAIIKIERCFSALREKHRQTSMRTKKEKKIADKTRLLNNKT